ELRTGAGGDGAGAHGCQRACRGIVGEHRDAARAAIRHVQVRSGGVYGEIRRTVLHGHRVSDRRQRTAAVYRVDRDAARGTAVRVGDIRELAVGPEADPRGIGSGGEATGTDRREGTGCGVDRIAGDGVAGDGSCGRLLVHDIQELAVRAEGGDGARPFAGRERGPDRRQVAARLVDREADDQVVIQAREI